VEDDVDNLGTSGAGTGKALVNTVEKVERLRMLGALQTERRSVGSQARQSREARR